jgi:hypothetical protein
MTNPLALIMLCLVLAPTSDAQNSAPMQLTTVQQTVAMPTVGSVLTNYVKAIGGTAS